MSATKSKTLNLWLANQLEKEDNIKTRATFKGHWSNLCDFTESEKVEQIAAVKIPKKWANTSLNRNVREFLKLNDLPCSRNPLNDHSAFEPFPILVEGWIYPTKDITVNKRRSRYDDNFIHFDKFRGILASVGFDKETPICVDRNGNILDGVYRMWIMADLNQFANRLCDQQKIYVRQYDFE